MSYVAYKCYYKEEAFRPLYWTVLSGSVNVNGDEIMINNGSAERVFPVSINQSNFDTIIFKAHGEYIGDSFTYQILNSSNNSLYSTVVYTKPQYDTFVVFPISFSGTPYKHRITSYYNIAIDFIAYAKSINVLSYIGNVLNFKVEKKTIRQRIPFSSDVIQTLGSESPHYMISYPRVPKTVYSWFEDAMVNGIGVCFILPTASFTGLIRSVEASLEPGTTLYNVNVEVWKGDNEIF